MPQLDLTVGTGERKRAGDRSPIVVLLDQLDRISFGLRVHRCESYASGGAGREPQKLTKADDRIEDGAGRV